MEENIDRGFPELVRRRQSDRGYCGKPVEREMIDRCLEAARLAPSACNSQPWFFVVVDDPERRKAVGEWLHDIVMPGNRFALSAPVLVVVVAERPNLLPRIGGLVKDKPYYLMDIGMAVENFCLQATEEGLGTCILGWFDEKGVQGVLGIPRSKRVPLVITLGYPENRVTRQKVRKDIDEIRAYNGYHR
jgi:nitroreductase